MKHIKLIFTIILFLTLFQLLTAQDYFYYKDKKYSLKISTKKIIVKFKYDSSLEYKKNNICITPNINPISEKHIKNNIVVAEIASNTTSFELQQIIKELNNNKDIEYANPYFIYSDSILIGLTNQIVVKLKDETLFLELEELTQTTKTNIEIQDKYNKCIYIIRTNKFSMGNAIDIANFFYETGKFEFSEPVFMKEAKICTNDQYYNQQWALENIGQNGGTPGADISIIEAWSITTGRKDIKIAVIDNGVDLSHPDLINNLLPGFDATGSGTNGGPLLIGDIHHGTACAGLICAQANNVIGIAGVAHNCSLIPISVNLVNINDIEIANAINWAWDEGQADVLSNSWFLTVPSSYVDAAIFNAATEGRSGLGCVILFASGNTNSNVSYPANNPYVIAVGATNNKDFRPSYSNYGAELDVVAPGGNSDIYTTGIKNTQEYIYNFGGTSASCPYAAGVMALILSVNSCLTQGEARRVLETSCDKVGGYCYLPGMPHGLWNNQMGYGRINAFKAVKYALSLETNIFFNVSGTNQGITSEFDWILATGGCSQLAAGWYRVKQHEIRKTVTFPYTQLPIIVGSANGFSAANPNDGNYYMQVLSLTETSATVRTWVYEIISTISGQPLSWVPTIPQNVRFNFTILSNIQLDINDIFLQNQLETTGTKVYSSVNKIETGSHVTNTIPFGNFIVDGNANVTLHGKNKVILKSGTYITPDLGGYFRACNDPFFVCVQNEKNYFFHDNEGFLPVIIDYEVKNTFQDSVSNLNKTYLNIFPNPTSENATIEYNIEKSEFVIITLHNNCGIPMFKLKNKTVHHAGTYQIKLNGINLSAGTYYCVLQTKNHRITKEIVILK